MSCVWYEQKLVDPTVDLWQHGLPSPLLRAHARECPDCTHVLEQESHLSDLFRELAENTRECEPSANVKHMLDACVAAKRREKRARAWKLKLAFATAGVVLGALIAFGMWRSLFIAAPARVAHQPAEHSAGPPSRPTRDISEPASQAKSATPPVLPVGARARNAADYYPIVMCDSLECSGPTLEVRVEVPASPLVNRGDPNRRVLADLLVGEDGIVRGVRVLQ